MAKKRPARDYVMVQVDAETRALFERTAKDAAKFLGLRKLGVSTWLRMTGVNAAKAHVGYEKTMGKGKKR